MAFAVIFGGGWGGSSSFNWDNKSSWSISGWVWRDRTRQRPSVVGKCTSTICRELLSIRLTPGNVDDRKPIPGLCKELFGMLFADKGYIAKWLAETLKDMGVKHITTVKKNMKPVSLTPFEKTVLRRRSLIGTVLKQMKNLCQIEHTRHCSSFNFAVNLMAGIIAYCLSEDKPTLSLIRVDA